MSALTEQLASVAAAAAAAGGEALLHHYGRATGVGTKSGVHDPVSDADREAEAVIVDRLLRARPDDGLLGEEGAERTGTSGLRWVIDPLDGTTNYLYGYPGWAVSVAAEDDLGGLVGVVHDPLRGETFTAIRGGGAWLGARRLAVNDPVRLADALVTAGFSFNAEDREREGALIARLLPRVRDLRSGGSVALGLAWVAAGRVDAFFQNRSSRWDWAAGALIAGEAGAAVRVDEGTGCVVACSPALADELPGLVVLPD
jgi:myo-inositol-1(or 4)-monophosphatase